MLLSKTYLGDVYLYLIQHTWTKISLLHSSITRTGTCRVSTTHYNYNSYFYYTLRPWISQTLGSSNTYIFHNTYYNTQYAIFLFSTVERTENSKYIIKFVAYYCPNLTADTTDKVMPSYFITIPTRSANYHSQQSQLRKCILIY